MRTESRERKVVENPNSKNEAEGSKGFDTREGYATAMFRGIEEKLFSEEPRLEKLNIGFGMTTQGRAGRALSEHWQGEASADGSVEITVRIDVADPLQLATVLVYQKVCTLVPVDAPNRRSVIKDLARRHGLKFAKTQPVLDESVTKGVSDIVAGLGPFPGAPVNVAYRPAGYAPKQTMRMRKAQCSACEIPIRISNKGVKNGLPFCSLHWRFYELEQHNAGAPGPQTPPPLPPGFALKGSLAEHPSSNIEEAEKAVAPVLDPEEDKVSSASETDRIEPAEPVVTEPLPPDTNDLVTTEHESCGDQPHELLAFEDEEAEGIFETDDHRFWKARFADKHGPSEHLRTLLKANGGKYDSKMKAYVGEYANLDHATVRDAVTIAGGEFSFVSERAPSRPPRPELRGT